MTVDSSTPNPYSSRAGITLTEILISIMIMGIGMVSLATLFPLGLLRLRDAARLSRTAYLTESASADLASRGLLAPHSFQFADNANNVNNVDLLTAPALPYWHYYLDTSVTPSQYKYHDPLVGDTPVYGLVVTGAGDVGVSSSQGIPFAYDPLWRWYTGIYLDPSGNTTAEARFGSGIGFLRNEANDKNSTIPSAHGLQRLTNFNIPSYVTGTPPTTTTVFVMPQSQFVPAIFVSPEDIVWQDPNYKGLYPMAGILGLTDPVTNSASVDTSPSSLVPDLSQDQDGVGVPRALADWRYTWMFTGRQVSSGTAGATFDGDIVIFENRPFALDQIVSPIDNTTSYPQAAGERVVEAVFGYTSNVSATVGTDNLSNPFGYGLGASKTVLLRWPATAPDPEVKVGSWIADVTYERNATVSNNRFGATYAFSVVPQSGQRCHWYQVVKAGPPSAAEGTLAFGAKDGVFRYMIVNVATSLQAFTALDPDTTSKTYGFPVHVNAALVSPHVIQVIPRTFTVN